MGGLFEDFPPQDSWEWCGLSQCHLWSGWFSFTFSRGWRELLVQNYFSGNRFSSPVAQEQLVKKKFITEPLPTGSSGIYRIYSLYKIWPRINSWIINPIDILRTESQVWWVSSWVADLWHLDSATVVKPVLGVWFGDRGVWVPYVVQCLVWRGQVSYWHCTMWPWAFFSVECHTWHEAESHQWKVPSCLDSIFRKPALHEGSCFEHH